MVWHMLQIQVDGKDFSTFHHRTPLERVCAIEIKGDVSVQTINFLTVRRCAFTLNVGAGDVVPTTGLCLFINGGYGVTTRECKTTRFSLSYLCCIRMILKSFFLNIYFRVILQEDTT